MDAALTWTRANVPDLAGRRVLITGANSGIGWEAARLLADRGASVTLGCRDQTRGREALDRLRARVPRADSDVLLIDLADLSSVRAAVERWRGAHGQLDVLVNNAGIMVPPLQRTADGFESQIGINHLGHFALTGLLLHTLLAADAARVVTVSSGAHRGGGIDIDDLNWERRRYRAFGAYAQSKLANLLFTFELQRRCAAAGLAVVALAAHPGWSATSLQGRSAAQWGGRIGTRIAALANDLVAQDAAHGALPTVAAAALPAAHGGDYWGPDGRGEMRGMPTRVFAAPAATDLRAARRLWTLSKELTGVSFDALDRADTD